MMMAVHQMSREMTEAVASMNSSKAPELDVRPKEGLTTLRRMATLQRTRTSQP